MYVFNQTQMELLIEYLEFKLLTIYDNLYLFNGQLLSVILNFMVNQETAAWKQFLYNDQGRVVRVLYL